MKILIATHNPAKFRRYKSLIDDIGDIEVVSLLDLGIKEKVAEPFDNAKENAIYKAKQYSEISGLTTVAIDEAANTNFLPNGEQPGVYVRRIKKDDSEVTDQDVLDFWQETFNKYPVENKKFIWEFYIAYFDPKTNNLGFTQTMAETSITEKFSKKFSPGYPMSSFLIFPDTDKPHSELTEIEKTNIDKKIFSQFTINFKNWLGR